MPARAPLFTPNRALGPVAGNTRSPPHPPRPAPSGSAAPAVPIRLRDREQGPQRPHTIGGEDLGDPVPALAHQHPQDGRRLPSQSGCPAAHQDPGSIAVRPSPARVRPAATPAPRSSTVSWQRSSVPPGWGVAVVAEGWKQKQSMYGRAVNLRPGPGAGQPVATRIASSTIPASAGPAISYAQRTVTSPCAVFTCSWVSRRLAQVVHDLVGLGARGALRAGGAAREPTGPEGTAQAAHGAPPATAAPTARLRGPLRRRPGLAPGRPLTGPQRDGNGPQLVFPAGVGDDLVRVAGPQGGDLPHGTTTTRNGLRMRSRSSLAYTAGRSVKATISGTIRIIAASASQGVRPCPETIASMPSQAAMASNSTPPAIPPDDR